MTASEVEIVQANRESLPLVLAWTLELNQHENEGDLQMSENFETNLKNWLSNEMANPNSLFLIAYYQQEPAGFIFASTQINDNGFLRDTTKGVINLIWIAAQYRHLKIASLLLSNVESCFVSIGINYVECHYTMKNQLAKNFWTSQDYVERGVVARKILRNLENHEFCAEQQKDQASA